MKRIFALILIAGLFAALPANGGQFLGGKSYLHTNTALVLPPGALDLSSYFRGFIWVKSSDNYLTNGTSALAASFGFSRRVELGFTQILYQDLNGTKSIPVDVSYMVPGNTYIRFKIANYSLMNNIFWGLMPALYYRVAMHHDIDLEPYQGNGIELELTSMLSYYVKPLYPDEAPSFHLNLGYHNHNDAETPFESSSALRFAAAAMIPRPRFDYGAELYGNIFTKHPPKDVFGREDWMYFTPMVRYKLFKGLHFTMGVDLLLLGQKETSKPGFSDRPNYSTWRLSGKINFAPSTAFYAAPTFVSATQSGGTGRERRSFESVTSAGGQTPLFNRQELFRWGIEERGLDVQSVDLDLEKIRLDRMKAEEELKALKAKLEEKQKKEAGK